MKMTKKKKKRRRRRRRKMMVKMIIIIRIIRIIVTKIFASFEEGLKRGRVKKEGEWSTGRINQSNKIMDHGIVCDCSLS